MADEEPTVETAEPTPSRRRWRRVAVRVLAVLVAVVAAVLVTVLTVDLGPSLRTRAEKAGSGYVHRPMHIGKLSAKLMPGVFVVEDVVIEGLTPTDRPWLKAKKITVNLPWWTIFSRKLIIESIDMTDWEMVVETFPGGRHNFPSFGDKNKKKGPSRFTTTLRSVVAARGHFVYDDHSTPWDVNARNLTVAVYRSATNYRGQASFSNGDVKIQSYERFRVDMQTRFKIENGIVHLDRIDLASDGAKSILDGDVDMTRWPEQLYRIKSHIDFPTQKRIFFHNERFNVSGQGDFTGTFHLYKGGRELKGTFDSPGVGVKFGLDPRAKEWRFPKLRGAVLWLPDRFDVTNTTCELFSGAARFDYLMGPFGDKTTPARAVWDVQYGDADLAQLTDFLETEGIRIAGRATGRNRLEWPLGKWAQKRGEGEITAVASGGTRTMTRAMPADRVAEEVAHAPEAGPFNPHTPLGYVPVSGHIVYKLDPDWITLEQGWVATPKTYAEFQGRTAYAERSRIPFHVTSLDWQESDRVLAGIMTAFGSPTGATPLGGYGEFDGVMLGAFARPRIEGAFRGERMRAWDVVWGSGRADLVVENSYVFVSKSQITSGESLIAAEGKFSLGYPRRDKGEEIDARVEITRRPLADLRHAFELDDYPVNGLLSGKYHLYGNYETPQGYGSLLIEDGTAYGETFERATSSLRFEGNGVRLDGIDVTKSTGSVTGAAWVGWAGDYSFNADGRRIPVEALRTVVFPKAPLSGLMQFNAAGAGTFDVPRYDVKLSVADLYAGEEGIGQVDGKLFLRGETLTIELNAASSRLGVVTGTGRIALTPEMDAEMTLRFSDTSLDPYIRFFQPQMSPFTTAIAAGTVRAVGELSDIDHLVIDTHVEDLNLKLFDYRLHNDGPIDLSLDQHVLEIQHFKVAGEGTELTLDGNVAFDENRIQVSASGDANLGILQGFFRDIRSSGSAALKAEVTGPLEKPVFSGSATLTNGRIRYYSLPHSLEAINGRMSFDAGGIRLDDVKAKLGGGDVVFGGRIAMNGFALGELSLTANGEQMRLRYPEGFRSLVDADLSVRGPTTAPVLSGTITIRDALWARRLEPDADILALTRRSTSITSGAATTTFPLRYNVNIMAPPGSLRIENNLAHIAGGADLKLQGTYDHPLLFGRANIDRGDFVFEGNRYIVTRGNVDFTSPSRIEPFFDIEAETRVRVFNQTSQTQTFRVTASLSGTPRSFSYALNSDPPLPEIDIISLVLGQTTNIEDAELRALRPGAAAQSEQQLIKQLGARILAAPITAPITGAVAKGFGIDTVQITPMLGSESDPLTASARLIIGKRISNRAYVTFARALGAVSRDQILVLEYDQSDILGWVLTKTSDNTFALDFRVRHRF